MSFDEILDLTADVFFHFVILVEFGTTLLWQTDHFLWLVMSNKMSAMSSQTRPPRNTFNRKLKSIRKYKHLKHLRLEGPMCPSCQVGARYYNKVPTPDLLKFDNLKRCVWVPGPPPPECTASLSLHTSSRSPRVCHSVPCRPDVPTHLGVVSPYPHKRELPGAPPHIGVVGVVFFISVGS